MSRKILKNLKKIRIMALFLRTEPISAEQRDTLTGVRGKTWKVGGKLPGSLKVLLTGLWFLLSFVMWAAVLEEIDFNKGFLFGLMYIAYFVIIVGGLAGWEVFRYMRYDRKPGIVGMLVEKGGTIYKIVFWLATLFLLYWMADLVREWKEELWKREQREHNQKMEKLEIIQVQNQQAMMQQMNTIIDDQNMTLEEVRIGNMIGMYNCYQTSMINERLERNGFHL